VRHAEVDGLRVLLDLGTERYRVLDDVASVLWSVLVGEADTASTFESLAREYELEHGRFRTDLAAFAQRCIDERLLRPADAPAVPAAAASARPAVRAGRAGTLQALTALIVTRRGLRRDGFGATYERYALLPVGAHARPLDAALPAFARAENFFVARRAPKDCLLRSLSLYRFLRGAGVVAEHVMGVHRFPFVAHAWVEVDGAPVCDERAQGFTRIARIGNVPAA
jgi:transglutaminase superfamily protein/coenzyme PQQ synthesis protein D (PqqD)